MLVTWNKTTQKTKQKFLSKFIELGKYHFYLMSERILRYRTDDF